MGIHESRATVCGSETRILSHMLLQNGYIREVVHTSPRVSDRYMQEMSIRRQSSQCKRSHPEEAQNRHERTVCTSRCIHREFITGRIGPRTSKLPRHEQSSNSRNSDLHERVTMHIRHPRPRVQLHMPRAQRYAKALQNARLRKPTWKRPAHRRYRSQSVMD